MLPLEGLTVVAIEQAVAAPFASSRLADAGARVIKVERPEGDFARGYDDVAKGQSSYFVWLNRGKESVTLDLMTDAGKAALEGLIAEADVLIQNLKPGAMAKLGFATERLRKDYPRLVTCSISGFGDGGPMANRKAYDLLIQAESGLCSITGGPSEPARVGISIVDIATGASAHTAILEAIIRRGITGEGADISVSMFDVMADWLAVPLLNHEGGKSPKRIGLAHPSIAPYGVFYPKSGAPVLISIQSDREWVTLCAEFIGDASLGTPGDHVIPLYTPECRECHSCLSGKTNLCTAIRGTQGQGLMPDGTTRFSMLDGTPIYHYMGCSTFANHTVMPEIALAKVREDAPFDKICYIGCGVTTGIGAVINTAGVEIGSTAAVFGLGGIGLNVIQGLRMAGADKIIGVDLNPDKAEMARKFGMTDFVNPKDLPEGQSVTEAIVEMTQTEKDAFGGVDYSFDATGNVQVMRDALECSHRGWGVSVIIGVAPAGAEISTRPFQLVTGRVWKGTAFGGAKGRTDVPKFVDWYMDGKIEIDPMITHTLSLDEINTGFDLMHAGESIRSVVLY